MDCGGDRIEKASVRIFRKVDDDLCSGCYRPRNYDVQHDSTVGAGRVFSGTVAATADRDCRYVRHDGYVEISPIVAQIAGIEPATQLDKSNALSRSIDAGWEVIQGRHLRRRVREARSIGTGIDLFAKSSKMWLRLWTIVETENALDDVIQIRGNMEWPRAPAIPASGVLVFLQFDTKRRSHGGHGARKNDGSACNAPFLHCQSPFAGKRFEPSNALRLGSVTLLEFTATQEGALLDWLREDISVDQRLVASAMAQKNGHSNFFVRVCRTYLTRSRERSAQTAGKYNIFLQSRHKFPRQTSPSS